MNQKGLGERAGGSEAVCERPWVPASGHWVCPAPVSRPHPLEWPAVDSKDVGIASRKLVERTHL